MNAVAERLNQLLAEVEGAPLEADLASRFERYLQLLMRWNRGMNLTSLREEESILRRHFVESILCARALPRGIESLLDFGSGAGFPGLPVAICRPEIAVTLAECQSKKAAFLREAVRTVGNRVNVYGGRAELLESRFGCVTLRAVDEMNKAVSLACRLVERDGWIAVMTTREEKGSIVESAESGDGGFEWKPLLPLPEGTKRGLLLGRRIISGEDAE